jgi:hypothetical protein
VIVNTPTKGALKAMLWAKTTTAVIISFVSVLAGGGTTIAVRAALGFQSAASTESEQALQGTWVGQEVGGKDSHYKLPFKLRRLPGMLPNNF